MAELNKYGVVRGSEEDISIHKSCKMYVDQMNKVANMKVKDLFPDNSMFDVDKLEKSFKSIHEFATVKSLVMSDQLYQSVRRDEDLSLISGEPLCISKVRARISKEEALGKRKFYENLQGEDWYRCIQSELMADGSTVPYLGLCQYAVAGTVPCFPVLCSQAFMSSIQKRTKGRDFALTNVVPPLKKSRSGRYVVAIPKRAPQPKAKVMAKGKAKAKAKPKAMAVAH